MKGRGNLNSSLSEQYYPSFSLNNATRARGRTGPEMHHCHLVVQQRHHRRFPSGTHETRCPTDFVLLLIPRCCATELLEDLKPQWTLGQHDDGNGCPLAQLTLWSDTFAIPTGKLFIHFTVGDDTTVWQFTQPGRRKPEPICRCTIAESTGWQLITKIHQVPQMTSIHQTYTNDN